MIDSLINLYSPGYTRTLVYMLQSSEYRVGPYLKWFWRTQNFGKVMRRGQLKPTKAARLLLLCLRLGVLVEIAVGLLFIGLWRWHNFTGGWEFGLAIILAYPVIMAHLMVVPLVVGRWLVMDPINYLRVQAAERVFMNHKGVKIAVAGSYGKTTMKELLATVLAAGKNVAATPANKNVPVSHAVFAKNLTGKEDILVIEYGEGAPGDVARFARITHPDHGVITGLAPAHLDKYKTLEAAGRDIFSLARHLQDKNVYVNGESPALKSFIKKTYNVYNSEGALGWKVNDIKVSISGTKFKLIGNSKSINLSSKLLGRHQVGALAFAAALAMKLGLSEDEVVEGVAGTEPFEHRMQPYQLKGAWIIDDTYNGNIEGLKAGTILLSELKAERKIYVTPGLVDQGREKEPVHIEAGKLIAAAKPDRVVLMKNSVTKYIEKGLQEGGYKGELHIELNPLEFYTNISEFIAVGDVVMMQNDWPDSYV